MLKVFVGENSFAIKRAIESVVNSSSLVAEYIDGEAINAADLANTLLGGTLFASQRLIIIRDLSANSQAWSALPDYIKGLAEDDSIVILVETKLDKRSKTYKSLAKAVEIQEFAPLSPRDIGSQLNWLESESKQIGLTIDTRTLRHLLLRVGPDQWRLVSALEKLKLKGEVTVEIIDASKDLQSVADQVWNILSKMPILGSRE